MEVFVRLRISPPVSEYRHHLPSQDTLPLPTWSSSPSTQSFLTHLIPPSREDRSGFQSVLRALCGGPQSPHNSRVQRSRPFPTTDPAGAQNPLPGPAIRGRGGSHPTVYGEMGTASKPTDSNGSVPSLCPHPWLGTPRAVWGEGEAPDVKGIEDTQARIGDGQFCAAEPFFTKVSVSGRSALEETPHLTISPARTLPLPGPACGGSPSSPPRGRGLLPWERSALLRPTFPAPTGVDLEAIHSVWHF